MASIKERQMQPDLRSLRLYGVTRSKGKMFELALPLDSHIAVPAGMEPQELLLLTVATLGDAAAEMCNAIRVDAALPSSTDTELDFSASYFDALLSSKFNEGIDDEIAMLASSAYFLARRPGSSLVLARRQTNFPIIDPVETLLAWCLRGNFGQYPQPTHPLFGPHLSTAARLMAYHFHDGSGVQNLNEIIQVIRNIAYEGATPRDLLLVDIASAVIKMRLASSVWVTLPDFSGVSQDVWTPIIRRASFPKQLWPSQLIIGRAGLYSGASGVVQMPTSAGKTRSIELMIRSALLSGRTNLVVVVAPFRALCHEIATSLRKVFISDAVKVNELTDVLQMDFMQEFSELLGFSLEPSQNVLVLTPEKFLYVLRQTPTLVGRIGSVIYDEGHQFDSGARGVTYELLLTEIKAILDSESQTVLISAVIQNAEAIGQWLIGQNARIVDGRSLMPTARSVAFASWAERLGQLMFFESDEYARPDYFVPRVIEQQTLANRPRESALRVFPERDSSDVALYLGLRLSPQGAVAIFCGRKDAASKIAERCVEVYSRGFDLAPPSSFSSSAEITKLRNLISSHFGDESHLTRAAGLGVFVHHGNTPHGLRLAIEHAMQTEQINFVVCTSTLAQGVNLPIRYLIVSSIYQGADKIRTRDFQNLMGRAGRAGIHTEGVVIFADPSLYDQRLSSAWRFRSSHDLLDPRKSENTASSLLALLEPILVGADGEKVAIGAADLVALLSSTEVGIANWASSVATMNPTIDVDVRKLVSTLKDRRKLLSSVESYLMASRGTEDYEQFLERVDTLSSGTLAYHLGDDEQKEKILTAFRSVAVLIQTRCPDTARQRIYSKTLLGINEAMRIEAWANENSSLLLAIDSQRNWISVIWPVLVSLSSSSFMHGVEPVGFPLELARRWLDGDSYQNLFLYSESAGATKPWGTTQRRRVTDEDVTNFCENTLGFECSLVVAAVAQYLYGGTVTDGNGSGVLAGFQKSLKYGLPDQLSVSCYEGGLADRVVSQAIRDAIWEEDLSVSSYFSALRDWSGIVSTKLEEFPSYFGSVYESRSTGSVQ